MAEVIASPLEEQELQIYSELPSVHALFSRLGAGSSPGDEIDLGIGERERQLRQRQQTKISLEILEKDGLI
jgi:hypothetical protein